MTTTLYRHILTLDRCAAARDIGALHRLVMAGYRHALNDGEDDARQRVGALFLAQRPDPRSRTQYPPLARDTHKVLVQARTPGVWATDHGHAVTHVTEPITVDPMVAVGDRVEVQALLNPTHSQAPTPRGDGTFIRGKRVPITDTNDVAAWFLRVMGERGLSVDPHEVRVGSPQRLRGTRTKTGSHSTLTFDVRTLRGVGTITDSDAFTAMLTDGVGRARAYGAGLIRHRKLA